MDILSSKKMDLKEKESLANLFRLAGKEVKPISAKDIEFFGCYSSNFETLCKQVFFKITNTHLRECPLVNKNNRKVWFAKKVSDAIKSL